MARADGTPLDANRRAPMPSVPLGWKRNNLRYGFNEIDGWPDFAFSPKRDEIHRRMRLMGTEIVRLFVFDKPVPSPFTSWRHFAAVVDAVIASGAKPMVTFAKFAPPFDDPKRIDRYVKRATEVVWSCLEQWGPDQVRDWWWCVWNEPNNPDVGGNLSYRDYLTIYRAVSQPLITLLSPHMPDGRVKIGGPSIDGTQRAYWLDWIAQLIADLPESELAFVNWHMYADWRPAAAFDTVKVKLVDDPVPPSGAVFEALTMASTTQYEARARSVARLLAGRDILNFCGELNTIAHHEDHFTGGLNRNLFGAAYYASAIINLMRGGADLEMRWTATSKHWRGRDDAYGLLSHLGEPTPAALAKQIIAQHVRRGDLVRFPDPDWRCFGIDAVIARRAADDCRSIVLVNTLSQSQTIDLGVFGNDIGNCRDVLWLDGGTGGRVARERCRGARVTLEGHGVAVLSEDAGSTSVD